jgi:hypothetical protein
VLIPCERAEATLSVQAPSHLPWASPPLGLPPEGGEIDLVAALERDETVASLRLSLEDAAGKAVGFGERSARAVLRAGETGVVVEPVPGTPIDPWVRRGLTPGAYRVEVSSPHHAPVTLEVELRAGDDLERRVRLGAPATLRVRIEAPGKRRARFRLVREERAVPAYAEDPKAAGAGDPDAPSWFADAEGTVLTGLGAGEVTVEVTSPDLAAEPVRVTLVEGEAREATLKATAK